jgi:surface protein
VVFTYWRAGRRHPIADIAMLFGCENGRVISVCDSSLPSWGTSRVRTMDAMFSDATLFHQNLSRWNILAAISMDDIMFHYATSFNQNLSRWDTSNVANMIGMLFRWAWSFNQDIFFVGYIKSETD